MLEILRKSYRVAVSYSLPKAQPETESRSVHISYFLQKCKKGKFPKKDLPLLKTISQVLNWLLGLWIHCSNMQSGLVTCLLEISVTLAIASTSDFCAKHTFVMFS